MGTGKLTASATQLSQKTLIAVPHPGAELEISVNDGYQACVYSGNHNNKINQKSDWKGTDGDDTDAYLYTLPGNSIYMRLSIRRTDGAAVSEEDFSLSGLRVAYRSTGDIVSDNAAAAEILRSTEHPVVLHISDIHGEVIRLGRGSGVKRERREDVFSES